MSDREITRRSMLQRSGVAVGTVALASSAGCLDSVPFIGGGASYSDWLPEPGTLGDGDHYRFTAANLTEFDEHEDELPDKTTEEFSGLEEFWSPVDVDWEDVSMLLIVRQNLIIESDFDKDGIVGDVEDKDGWDDDSEHEGYQILVNNDETQAVAVGDNHIVTTFAFDGGDVVDNAESLIDTANGNEDRYVDESEDMDELVSELGEGTIAQGRTMEEPDEAGPEQGLFENQVGKGEWTQLDGDTADVKYVVVYESESDVDTGDLEDYFDANTDKDQKFEHWDDEEFSQNGRLGLIEGTVDTDDLNPG